MLPLVGLAHNHLHGVGLLIGEGHIPAGVDVVQLALVDVRHPVLADKVMPLRAATRGPPGGEREVEVEKKRERERIELH